MPKQVDHRQRRSEIAAAVSSLVSTRGLDAVSLRDVAAEAGISMGRVQHYFKTKDEMLLFALEDISEQGRARVEERLAGLPDPEDPRAVLREVLDTMLGSGPDGDTSLRVGVAFQARALVEPRLAEHVVSGYAGLQDLMELLISAAIAAGRIEPDRDPNVEATALFALGEGLGTHLLLGHGSLEHARRVLDSHLERLFRD